VQQTRGGAIGRGLLGDQFFGKFVMETGDQHAGRL
jgi:hypothetical protein